ncbi:protein D2 [Pelomyxa schiedti]|nr:protein D2 [Pelomyxa schiedti]
MSGSKTLGSEMADVIQPFEPVVELGVTYGGVAVSMNNLTPPQAAAAPKVSWAPESPSTLYTLVMTDPDAPSRASPKFREWRHWVVVNIPGSDLSAGKTLASYMGPAPPPGTGPHRYIFLLFRQNKPVTASPFGDNRGAWKVNGFASANGLVPVGCTMFYAQR